MQAQSDEILKPILGAIASYQLEKGEPISGSRLRMQFPNRRDEVDDALKRARLRYLMMGFGEDYYAVNFAGLHETPHIEIASEFLNKALRFLRAQYQGNPDIDSYRWQDLEPEVGVPLETARSLLRIAGLASGWEGDSAADTVFTIRPKAAEEIYVRCKDFSDLWALWREHHPEPVERAKKRAPVQKAQYVQQQAPVAEDTDDDARALFDVGEATVVMRQVRDAPWKLGVDAFCLPAGTAFEFPGGLASSFKKTVGAKVWEDFERAARVENDKQRTFGPASPLYVPMPASASGLKLPGACFVATTVATARTPANAGLAAVAIAERAGRLGLSRVTMPLFGTGGGGLPAQPVIRAMLRGLVGARLDGISEIVITTRAREDLATAVREAKDAVEAHAAARLVADASSVALNDAPDGPDCLDIDKQVRMFAEVVASKDLKAPLAIGLFGEWGSGKSFFMEKLRRKVSGLAQAAGDLPADHALDWSRISQIEFNAWHYMDSDLWATLAGNIFEKLARELGAHDRVDHATARRKLRSRLESTIAARDAAFKAVTDAQARVDELHAEVAELKKKRAERLETASGVVSAIWQAFKSDPELKKTRGAAERAAKRLRKGMTDEERQHLLSVPQHAEALAVEARAATRSWRGLLGDLMPKSIAYWCFAVAVIVVLPLLPTLIDWFGAVWGQITGSSFESSMSWVTAAALQFGTIGTTVITFITRRFRDAKNLAEHVQGLRERVDGIRENVLKEWEDKDKTTDHKAVYAELEQVTAELDGSRQSLARAEELIVETQRELEAIGAGQLVYDFVLERTSEGGPYRSREGIVSIVRRDLQHLSDLLRDWNLDAVEARKAKEARAAGGAVAEESDDDKALREDYPVQRIILYIDDLDRCPVARVVEVLQAVHLLLAFDLFVVVVGVDPRWLERSLEASFKTLIGDDVDGSNGHRHHPAATAKDYLEKIFQVPFTLPKVNDLGFKGLIDFHLADTATTDEPAPAAAGTPPTGTPVVDSDPVDDGGQRVVPDPDDRVQPADDPTPPPAPDPTPAADANGQRTRLTLEEHERTFMLHLYPFITTPRLVKRFVNVYQLLRVGVEPRHHHDFVKDSHSAYHRFVQLMLAINTGFPRVGTALMRALAWPEQYRDVPATWKDLVDATGNPSSGFIAGLQLSQPQLEELADLHVLLEAWTQPIESNLAPWKEWAPRVGRYSMYWRGK